MSKSLHPYLPLSLFWGDFVVHPMEKRAAFPVSVQGAGKEASGLFVGVVALEYQRGA